MSRAVWPHLVARGGGAVVNMSSLAATRGFSQRQQEIGRGTAAAWYYAAKAGHRCVHPLDRRRRRTAQDPRQLRAPRAGPHSRRDHSPLPASTGSRACFDFHQILEEPGQPEDVANVVLFLASDEAKFLTGEIINVDGGCAVKL